MACRREGWYTAPPLALSRALTGLAAPALGLLLGLLLGGSHAAYGLEPPPAPPVDPGEDPAPAAAPAMGEEVAALRDDMGAMWLQLDRLTDGAEPPRWASAEHERLDRRLERVTAMLERLSARIETPVPRLDEPITLLTVSLCTLILGFLAGRGLQRRNSRKDSRFRL